MSPLQKLTIAVDVDEVCADLLSEWIRRYNRDYEDSITLPQITQWDMTQVVKPECGKRIYEYLNEPDLYRQIKPYPEALGAVEFLRRCGHRVVFATTCVRKSYDTKIEWLVENGFIADERVPKDVYPCGDKSLIMADVLVDDGVHNLETFPKWKVLVSRPHNLKADPKFPHWRVSDLMQAAQRIDSVLGRMIRTA